MDFDADKEVGVGDRTMIDAAINDCAADINKATLL